MEYQIVDGMLVTIYPGAWGMPWFTYLVFASISLFVLGVSISYLITSMLKSYKK